MWRKCSITLGNSLCRKICSRSYKRFVALWGNGDYGRLGLGNLESPWVPTLCDAFDKIDDNPRSVACGGAHTLFLTDKGHVYATGMNDFGQLGVLSMRNYCLVPVHVSGLPEDIVCISAGYRHSSAITSDGQLYMWGNNSTGQLGLGRSASKIASEPAKVEYLAGLHIEMAALGSEHSAAITEEGVVLTWGAGGSGRLGHGPQSRIFGFSRYCSEYIPRAVKDLEGIRIKRIAAGMLHTACISEHGLLFLFGERTESNVIFGVSKISSSPSIFSDLPLCLEVACGGYHTCIITDGGELYTWGSNENGCLGLGYSNMISRPERVETQLLSHPVMEVSCGWKHTAAICGGKIFSWGWGGSHGTFSDDDLSSGGQLGHGNDVDCLVPTEVKMTERVRACQVSCGFNHTAAIFQCPEDLDYLV